VAAAQAPGPDPLEITVEATQYTITPAALRDTYDGSVWSVTVEYRGKGKWAVLNVGRTLTVDGDWEEEPRPSSREDNYLARCRFELEDALRLAQEVLPTVRWNGMTPADVVARHRSD